MGFEEYCRLIDGCKRWTYTLNLFQWGDPLNAPRIYDMVRYAHDAHIFTHISTTLAPFKADADNAEKLVNSGLDLLSCSFHGASDTTFAYYQGDNFFADALEKVRLIVQTRDRLHRSTPQIQMHCVVTRANEHQTEAFAKLAERYGCKAIFTGPSLNLRFLSSDKSLQPLDISPKELEEKVRTRLHDWLPKNPRYVAEAYRRIRDGEADFRDFDGHKVIDCEWPWKAVIVNWDSTVSVCCGSWAPSQDYGDLKRNSWGEIWNSPTYRLARRSFKPHPPDHGSPKVACTDCPGSML